MEEDEYFPAISMSSASCRGETSSNHSTIILKSTDLSVPEDPIDIKDEPFSEPHSPSGLSSSEFCKKSCGFIQQEKTTITMVSPQSLHMPRDSIFQTSDSEEDEEEDSKEVSSFENVIFE